MILRQIFSSQLGMQTTALVNLKIFLHYLLREGLKYGYYVKLTKTVPGLIQDSNY
jgi:hypothetical protein